MIAAPRPFREAVIFPDGLQLRVLSSRKAVETGQGPGAFPGRKYVVFEVQATNVGKSARSLNAVVTTVVAGSPPRVPMPVYPAESNAHDFFGVLPPGRATVARYAFAMESRPGEDVALVLDIDAEHSQAIFTGPLTLDN